MGETMMASPATELRALLAEERTALAAGALDTVAGLAERKMALLDALDGAPVTRSDLDEITAAATRNAGLLTAASEGILGVLTRLRDLQSATGGTTYGPDGRLRRTGKAGMSRRL
jgi:flagellar biosynthesis/type III secretory pathway chaperone